MGKVTKGSYCGEPVLTYKKPKSSQPYRNVNPQESDEFNSTTLGKQWQWHANYQLNFGQPTPLGFMRIFSLRESAGWKNLWECPNLLLQKTPADEFTATTKIKFAAKDDGQYGGIIMMGQDYSCLVVKRAGDQFQLQQRTCKKANKGSKESVELVTTLNATSKDKIDYQPAIYEEIYLRMVVKDSKVDFYYSTNGKKYKKAGSQFTMREGQWIGAKIGFVAGSTKDFKLQGYMDVDWFRVTK